MNILSGETPKPKAKSQIIENLISNKEINDENQQNVNDL
jgi:hypothetical protein